MSSKFDDLNDWNVVKLFLELGADPNVITSGKYQQDDQYRFLEFNTGKVCVHEIFFCDSI